MATDRMDVLELLRKATSDGDVDLLREGVRILSQALMEAEVAAEIGAAHGERAPERRSPHLNGYRARRWDTRVGSVELQIRKAARGQLLPIPARAAASRRARPAERGAGGLRGRRVDPSRRGPGGGARHQQPVPQRGEPHLRRVGHRGRGLPRPCARRERLPVSVARRAVSQGARGGPCGEHGDPGRHRRLGRRRAQRAGRRGGGRRRRRGRPLAPFLQGLNARGLSGVRLVISDAHAGLTAAISASLLGASWQRCRVHAMRNALGLVPKGAQSMVAAAIRSIFEQPDEPSARSQLRRVIDGLQPRFARVAELLTAAEADLLAHFTFPSAHRRQIRSTNPLERLNKEIRRRTDVVGIFPNRTSLLRLVGMLLAEQDDEWSVGRRYFSVESMALIGAPQREEVLPALLIAS